MSLLIQEVIIILAILQRTTQALTIQVVTTTLDGGLTVIGATGVHIGGTPVGMVVGIVAGTVVAGMVAAGMVAVGMEVVATGDKIKFS